MAKPIRSITAAPVEVLTLEQVRLHLKLDTDTSGSPPTHPDDALITTLITTARQSVESYLDGRIVVNQSFELALDEFPNDDEICLQAWPVTSFPVITYVDAAGVTQTMDADDYGLDDYVAPCRIVLPYYAQWPITKQQINSVKVTFNAGSTDTLSPNEFPCPLPIKQAMLLTIGHLYENRQSTTGTQRYELPDGVKALLQPYRINMGM